jgi:hypothetical protein
MATFFLGTLARPATSRRQEGAPVRLLTDPQAGYRLVMARTERVIGASPEGVFEVLADGAQCRGIAPVRTFGCRAQRIGPLTLAPVTPE